jgi:elongation factor 1-alpha
MFVGPEGCGKTTVLSHLCNLLQAFDEESLKACEDLAKDLGRPYSKHCWMLDTLMEERERGLTIEPRMHRFQSGSNSYTAFDTPGHAEFATSMLSVTSLADVAVLVVPATVGEWEAGADSGGVRELALSCFTTGIKHVVVLVTKMDDLSVSFASARFEDIKKVVEKFLKDVGYKMKDVPFVPVCGLSGDNLTSKSSETSWYTGPTVIEALDAIGAINRPAEKPLRVPVLKVHDVPDVGTVIVGRVEFGSLKPGTKVVFSPSGRTAEVRSLQIGGEDASEARSGDIVGFSIGDDFGPEDFWRGMVASSLSNDPVAACEEMVAQVIVLDHPGSIRAGYCPAITVHTAQVPCEFEELLAKIDRKTGEPTETNPESGKTGDVLKVRMRPIEQVCIEAFSAYASLGRFTVRDHGRTVAVGVVKEVTKRPIPKVRSGNDNSYFDS